MATGYRAEFKLCNLVKMNGEEDELLMIPAISRLFCLSCFWMKDCNLARTVRFPRYSSFTQSCYSIRIHIQASIYTWLKKENHTV